jgi:hypothetical protein
MKGGEYVKQRGVVLKIQNGYCYVLTPDRRFLKVPALPNAAIGQEIEWIHPELEEGNSPQGRSGSRWKRFWLPVAGVAASFLLALGIWQGRTWFQPANAFAYVSLDINPSIELSVDRNRRVLEQHAWNDDGKKVLSEISIAHDPVQQAIRKITKQAQLDGFLKPDSDILVTATPVDTRDTRDLQSIQQLQNFLVSDIRSTLPAKTVLVKGMTVSSEVRKAAEKAHLSPGKFALYLQAQAQGVPITVDQLQKQPISELVKNNQTLKSILDEVNPERLDDLLGKWNKQQLLPSQRDQAESKSEPQNNAKSSTETKGRTDQTQRGQGDDKKPTDNRSHGETNTHGQNDSRENDKGKHHGNNSGHEQEDKPGGHGLLPIPSNGESLPGIKIELNPNLQIGNLQIGNLQIGKHVVQPGSLLGSDRNDEDHHTKK